MAADFGVSTQMVSNSLPAYFLGLAVGQLLYGPISDRIGRKPPLYFGLSLYILASLLCMFAQNEWSLIAARVLQALGGCVGVVVARATIRDRLDMQATGLCQHDDCNDHCTDYCAKSRRMGTDVL